MPPAATPEEKGTPSEQKIAESVYDILRKHIAYAAATRAEIRSLRNELHKFSEDIMKISELSSSVDRLISAATAIKNAPQPEQPDDPAIGELHDKIQRAIDVLEGRGGASSNTEPGFQPAPSSAEAQATDINNVDPNAR